ncbi:MAG: PIN domain-containing protein [Deltaproteobacteria bacterium]|nr:PIN domain-containing protein [Deltaproteobacteria bacterium]
MRIYLDVCCLNRPFDDQTQDRIHLESEAVILILKRVWSGHWEWISSEAVDFEVRQTPDAERRRRVESLIRYADRSVLIEASVVNRASELKEIGFGAYDALDLACAEHCNADVFLTTDDKLLRLARESSSRLKINVQNPLIWLKEVIENEYRNYDS